MRRWIILSVVGLLAACSPSGMLERIADAEKLKIARDYIEQLKTGDLEKLAAELDPSLRNDKELEQLKTMRAMIPAEPATVTEMVGYHWRKNLSGEATYNITHQFRHGDKWLLVVISWREKDGEPRRITGFRVVPLEKSLQETNAFTFRNAGPLHYLFVAGLVVIPGFILFTLVACIRTRIPKHKWLWIIFVLVGFVKVSLNWTTGETGVNFLAFQLLGASAFAPLFSAWILSLSVPVGAIVFWIKRPAWLAAATQPPEPPPLTAQS